MYRGVCRIPKDVLPSKKRSRSLPADDAIFCAKRLVYPVVFLSWLSLSDKFFHQRIVCSGVRCNFPDPLVSSSRYPESPEAVWNALVITSQGGFCPTLKTRFLYTRIGISKGSSQQRSTEARGPEKGGRVEWDSQAIRQLALFQMAGVNPRGKKQVLLEQFRVERANRRPSGHPRGHPKPPIPGSSGSDPPHAGFCELAPNLRVHAGGAVACRCDRRFTLPELSGSGWMVGNKSAQEVSVSKQQKKHLATAQTVRLGAENIGVRLQETFGQWPRPYCASIRVVLALCVLNVEEHLTGSSQCASAYGKLSLEMEDCGKAQVQPEIQGTWRLLFCTAGIGDGQKGAVGTECHPEGFPTLSPSPGRKSLKLSGGHWTKYFRLLIVPCHLLILSEQ
ncbi:hypothetical protein ACRRTK_005171 [Alexandromys fortis]